MHSRLDRHFLPSCPQGPHGGLYGISLSARSGGKTKKRANPYVMATLQDFVDYTTSPSAFPPSVAFSPASNLPPIFLLRCISTWLEIVSARCVLAKKARHSLGKVLARILHAYSSGHGQDTEGNACQPCDAKALSISIACCRNARVEGGNGDIRQTV